MIWLCVFACGIWFGFAFVHRMCNKMELLSQIGLRASSMLDISRSIADLLPEKSENAETSVPSTPSWLDQIEIWFSILQRKHLQPNHFVSTTALEASLKEFISYYNQEAKLIKWTYTVEKLEMKLGAIL